MALRFLLTRTGTRFVLSQTVRGAPGPNLLSTAGTGVGTIEEADPDDGGYVLGVRSLPDPPGPDRDTLVKFPVADLGGGGDVTGSASSFDAELARFSGTTGKVIQSGGRVYVADGLMTHYPAGADPSKNLAWYQANWPSGSTHYYHRYPSLRPGQADWNVGVAVNDNPGGGPPDIVFGYGWNATPGSAPADPALPGGWAAFESDYAPGADYRSGEYHLLITYQPPNRWWSTSRRNSIATFSVGGFGISGGPVQGGFDTDYFGLHSYCPSQAAYPGGAARTVGAEYFSVTQNVLTGGAELKLGCNNLANPHGLSVAMYSDGHAEMTFDRTAYLRVITGPLYLDEDVRFEGTIRHTSGNLSCLSPLDVAGGITASDVSDVYTVGAVAPRGLRVSQHNTGIQAAVTQWRKSRGTRTSPTAAANGDIVGALGFTGYDGAGYPDDQCIFGGRITGAVSGGTVPVSLYFAPGSSADYTPTLLLHHTGLAGLGKRFGDITSVLTQPTAQLDVRPPASLPGISVVQNGTTPGEPIRVRDSGDTTTLGGFDAAGRLVFDAANTAPSDTTTPDAWVTATVGGTAYRIPLYTP